MNSISVIDCATETLSNNCYNRLVECFEIPSKFHCPSMFGMNSLQDDISSAYIVLGSYSNVEDRLDWQISLANYLDEKLNEGIPVLGICFGHQLMANFYGAEIVKNNNDINLEGTRIVTFNGIDSTFFVSHSFQVKKLPAILKRLGSSPQCENEVIEHKNLPFVGIQSHPGASSFFIQTTLKDIKMTTEEKNLAQEDGLKFIKRFLEDYNLL